LSPHPEALKGCDAQLAPEDIRLVFMPKILSGDIIGDSSAIHWRLIGGLTLRRALRNRM